MKLNRTIPFQGMAQRGGLALLLAWGLGFWTFAFFIPLPTARADQLLMTSTDGIDYPVEAGLPNRRIVVGGDPDSTPSLMQVLRRSSLILVPLLLAMLAAILWSWSLRRQVASKTRDLQMSLERFRGLAESAPVGIAIFDNHNKTLHASKRFTEIYGYTIDDVPTVDAWWPLAYPDEKLREEARRTWAELFEKERGKGTEIPPMEFPVTCKDKTVRHTEIRAAAVGELNFTIFTDVTDRHRLEDQLIQAQKLEAVGRLAGGVAHDFNNMLGIIIGFAELALDDCADNEKAVKSIQEIIRAGKRSAEITRQLLAFARRQTVRPIALNLNAAIEDMLSMLRRLIGEHIELIWTPDQDCGLIFMDPSQLDQILMNLCVNARDAIRRTGRVTIETVTITQKEPLRTGPDTMPPGEYVLLAVTDNGAGMDKEIREHVFDPFFTTKKTLGGVGLGLATVYGIVRQNHGFINVTSECGMGSTFSIYLPKYEGEVLFPTLEYSPPHPAGRAETILLIEDEPALLDLTRKMLVRLGYCVLTAATPTDAILLARDHHGPIHLLLTDVVMPDMNGRDVARQVETCRPNIRVLFMSGYTEDVIAQGGVLEDNIHFIQKPLTIHTLSASVREVLDQPS